LAHVKNGLVWAVCGSTGFAVILPMVLLSRNPYVVTVVAVVGQCCVALFWPAMQSWVGGEPDPKMRSRRIGWFNVSWTLGLTLSPPVSGRLYDMDYRLPFVCVFVVGLVTALLTLSLPHERRQYGEPAPATEPGAAGRDGASEAHLYCAWAANMVGWALTGVMRSVFPKRIHELVAAGELVTWFGGVTGDAAASVGNGSVEAATQFGWLALTMYASRAVISLVLGSRHGWHHQFWLLAMLQLAAGGAFLVLGMTKSLFVMALCCVVVGVNGGVCFFASLFYSLSERASKHRRAAIHESMVGVGSFTGSVIFGELAGRYGTTYPFFYTPLFVAAAIVLQMLLLRYGKRKAGAG
jgi:DHA1 family quinolone resistance protein-like MFS transporter